MTTSSKEKSPATATSSPATAAAAPASATPPAASLSSTNASSSSGIKHHLPGSLAASKTKLSSEQNNKKQPQHLPQPQQPQHQNSPKSMPAKSRATPTKIVERRPLQLASNKNLNNVKKQPPNRGLNLPLDQVEGQRSKGRLMLSDTSRLSRNMSKDDRTDNGEDESSHSEASIQEQHQKLQRVRKTRKARANSSSSRRPSEAASAAAHTNGAASSAAEGGNSTSNRKYAPEKYSDREGVGGQNHHQPPAKKRPSSATGNALVNRRSNSTLTPPSGSSKNEAKSPRGASAATAAAANTMQKSWRAHSAKERDAERVHQLKEEVRHLRTDEHVKHLTKELANAKQALDRERKLRALQMDAIKVLWKEVQLMDEAKTANGDNDNGGGGGGGGGQSSAMEKSRPSGRGGSKISSRSSEHSIAKLMETLHATAGVTPSPSLQSLKNQPGQNSNQTPSAASAAASMSMSSASSCNNNQNMAVSMAQSMPASVLAGQLNEVNAVEALSKTCNSLQSQVEQLQSSLVGVMQFMSNFHHSGGGSGSGGVGVVGQHQQPLIMPEPQQLQQHHYHQQQQLRGRHSSNESSSLSYFHPIVTAGVSQMTQSIGPMSLPICHPVPLVAVTHQPYSEVTAPASVGASVGTAADSGIMAMSRSCDCLTQTDISAVLTPRNEQMPPDPPAAQFLQFKKVDISLETSDSEAATSSGRPGLQQLSQHQSRLLQQSDNGGGGGGGGATSGGLCRSRSKSPRPQTLPGLVKASAENQAENRVTSPQVGKYLHWIGIIG